jgi:hypothetical protein
MMNGTQEVSMAHLMTRFRMVLRSFGNEGAVANVEADIASTAAAHRAVDRLASRVQAGGALRAA